MSQSPGQKGHQVKIPGLSSQGFPAILVVNKDAAIRNALRVVLNGAGYFVWEVGTVRDAIEIAEHIRFDLVVVDKIPLSSSEGATLDALRHALPQVQYVLRSGFCAKAIARVARVFERLVNRRNGGAFTTPNPSVDIGG